MYSRWLMAAVLALSAQAEEAKSPGIGVTVSDIFDNRTTGNATGECRVFLNLSGDAFADAHSIRRIRVTRATDELGRDLTRADDPPAAPIEFGKLSPADEQLRLQAVAAEVARRRQIREAGGGAGSSPAVQIAPPVPIATAAIAPASLPAPGARVPFAGRPWVTLRSPSRRSASIKLLEGEIELFTPTTANGGMVQIARVAEKPGTFLASAGLDATGIRLMYLPLEGYTAQRAAPGVDAKATTGPWSDDTASAMKLLETLPGATRRPLAVFYLEDPQHLIVTAELRGADGRLLERGTVPTRSPQLRVLYLDAPLPADAQLSLLVASPGAVKTYPFKLENVPLP